MKKTKERILLFDLGHWLREFVSSLDADRTHDIDHVERVWRLCQQIVIADNLSVDMEVLMAGAYLHDVIVHPKHSAKRRSSSSEAADRAVELLMSTSFPSDRLPAVRHAIAAHSFSAGIEPETLEAKVLQDADRIEALGAFGIARTFYAGSAHGARLLDFEDPLANGRPLDETTFVLDHFQQKAFGLVDKMQTSAGREIGARRLHFLKVFVDELLHEAGHKGILCHQFSGKSSTAEAAAAEI